MQSYRLRRPPLRFPLDRLALAFGARATLTRTLTFVVERAAAACRLAGAAVVPRLPVTRAAPPVPPSKVQTSSGLGPQTRAIWADDTQAPSGPRQPGPPREPQLAASASLLPAISAANPPSIQPRLVSMSNLPVPVQQGQICAFSGHSQARRLYIPDARTIGAGKRRSRAFATACEVVALGLFVAAVLFWSAFATGRL